VKNIKDVLVMEASAAYHFLIAVSFAYDISKGFVRELRHEPSTASAISENLLAHEAV
jgi:hypothetical protein